MAVQLMTVSAYARHRGCDEKAVRKAITENRITAIADADGKRRIDPAVADIQWAQNTRARADSTRSAPVPPAISGAGLAAPVDVPVPDPGQSAGQPNYADYRTRTERATAERAERDNMREAGKLAYASEIERGIYDSYRALRDAAMAVAQRAAPRCIGLGDARDIERVISDELRKAFDGWEARMLELLPRKDGT